MVETETKYQIKSKKQGLIFKLETSLETETTFKLN